MENVCLIFLVVKQAKVLENDNVISKMLQATDVVIKKAVGLLQNTIQVLSEYRNDFDQVKHTAQNLAGSWEAQMNFVNMKGLVMVRAISELMSSTPV